MRHTITTTSRRNRRAASLPGQAGPAGMLVGLFGALCVTLVLGVVGAAPAQAAGQAAGSAQQWTPMDPVPTGPGWTRITDRESLMDLQRAAGITVLHVDTEHADADGFWFAIAGAANPALRPMRWIYQPYAAKCTDPETQVTWNGWKNQFECQYPDAVWEHQRPGSAAHDAACVSATGRPWSLAEPDSLMNAGDGTYIMTWPDQMSDTTCTNANLAPGTGANLAPGTGLYPASQEYPCAPWEDLSLNAQGTHVCDLSSPGPWLRRTDGGSGPNGTWVSTPEPRTWEPAPDSCTGAPSWANDLTRRYHPDADPNLGRPGVSCDGAALPPNCAAQPATPGDPAVPNNRLCTEATPATVPFNDTVVRPQPPTSYTESYTATTAVPPYSGAGWGVMFFPTAVTETRVAAMRRGTVRVVVRKHGPGKQGPGKQGHMRRAVGLAPVLIRVTRSATVATGVAHPQLGSGGGGSGGYPPGTPAVVSASATCTRPTQYEAQNCARAQAQADATAKAQLVADQAGQQAAQQAGQQDPGLPQQIAIQQGQVAQARAVAGAQAQQAADQALRATKVTKRVLRAAKAAAVRSARRAALARLG